MKDKIKKAKDSELSDIFSSLVNSFGFKNTIINLFETNATVMMTYKKIPILNSCFRIHYSKNGISEIEGICFEPTGIKYQKKRRALINVFNEISNNPEISGKTITDINKISIGKPIINTQVYILDENKSICPIGIPGEIYISGDGVGNGYLNNSTLNNKSFIKNPFISDTLMYKTGDLGMYNENGEIIYLNRIDNQIKIRGYRIELDEISNNILKFNGISKCVVIDNENESGKKYLAAYFVAEKNIDIIKLKNI
jgi:non-ribosomal peptide synthetase component F